MSDISSFIHSFIHSLKDYLWSVHCVPDTEVAIGDTVVNKADTGVVPALTNLMFCLEKQAREKETNE